MIRRVKIVLACIAIWIGKGEFAVGAEKGRAPQEKMSYLDNGQVRIGVDLNLGGSITYLASVKEGKNIINNHDWGRQIQMSFYSGPTPFEPNGKKPAQSWAVLGWNPIQSGDCYGYRSKVTEHRNDGKELYVKCIPMHWPLKNEPGKCTFETWIRLEKNTALVRSRINNQRTDKTQYPGREQELPALYTNGIWYRLFTYTGDQPFTGGKLTRIKNVWRGFQDAPDGIWENWLATENWAALVREDDRGVGIWKPDCFSFKGGFFGTPGVGGSKDVSTGYIAPIHRDILDHNIQYNNEYVLIVGTLQEIRDYVYQHASKKTLPDYRFVKDRQHWVYHNATDTGWPIRGELHIRPEKGDPQMIGPAGFWRAKDVPKLYLRAAFQTKQNQAQLFWKTHAEQHFNGGKSKTFTVQTDGKYRTYEIDLAGLPEYKGVITGLRLDPVFSGSKGDGVKIKSISYQRND